MKVWDYKIYAVDFDGTLSFGQWPGTGPENAELIEFLKEQQKNGDKIILWTCREGKSLDDAVIWCKSKGLIFDAVNENLAEKIDKYGNDSRKISCDYYIDDRALSVQEFQKWRDQHVRQGTGQANVEYAYSKYSEGIFG